MKTHLSLLVTAGLILFVFLLAGFGGDDLKHSSGADPGYTNSPGDGKNCTHCMGGTALPVTDWITSDVPGTGYIPGNTYTITVTATGTGNKGFEVSPQDLTGNLIGTLTAGIGNQLVGSGKYVTHTHASSANPKTWTFQWTAPSAGAGDVTFYGSVAVGKLNTKTTTMTVSQSTVGISENAQPGFILFPNPAHQQINVSFSLETPSKIRLDLLSVNGERIINLVEESFPAGHISRTFTINQPAGFYFLRMNSGENTQLGKVILQ
jgi:hypothetical protein